MTNFSPIPPPPEGTALALVEAGLEIFGRKGFDAASTREIAALAKANIAAITYHFGGKEGLRLACATEFARRASSLFAFADLPIPHSAQEARATISLAVERMTEGLFTENRLQMAVAFALREITEQGPGLDVIYQGLALPGHQRLCQLWARATGHPADSDAVKLAVFSMIGQVLYFRIGAPVIARRMGWPEIGPPQARQIAQTARENLHARLDTFRRASS